jgi:hypothetical protein
VSPPIPPNAKTSALIALARSRRMQRAIAHAYLHRDQPLPSLRLSLGFVTSTACTSDDYRDVGHRMTIAGVADGIAYVVEQLGTESVIYKLFLRGPRQGNLVPASKLPAELAPCTQAQTEAWMLSTRVVQRRALRLPMQDDDPRQFGPALAGRAIRKYALQVRVEPVSGAGPSGYSTVTAFLRPEARLADVWMVPGETTTAIARVTYLGVPSGLGLPKDTVVLLTE